MNEDRHRALSPDSICPVSLVQGNMTRVSSPVSTGGAGTSFEQHVGAYWLAQLLIGSIPPILIDTTVVEVGFQTEWLGYQTDDFLISCANGEAIHNIAGQVKRSFTVSALDKECVQTVVDFWRDFNASRFSKDSDRLALVTLRGTNTLLEHFVSLLDCARAARDGAEFEQRLHTQGFISDISRRYCGELQKIISDVEGMPVTAAFIWPILRVTHVLSLDLNSSTRQAEAHIKCMLALTVAEGDSVASANASWNELVGVASTAMATSRSIRREDLPAVLRARHGVIGTNERRVLQALGEHTTPVLRAIRSTLGRDFHLPRATLVQNVLDALETTQVVLITGPSGSGKSAVGKDAVSVLALDHFLFGFRVEEFAQAHIDTTLAAAQVPANWEKLRAILGAQARKIILIESVERLLEKTTRDAFTDLLTLAKDDSGLRIVLTCRDYSIEQIRASFLQPHCIYHKVIHVPPLENAELTDVETAYPALAIPLESPALRNLMRNPFVLNMALVISWSSERPLPQTERDFRSLFWREIVRGGHRVPPSLGRPREESLQTIAVRRARALSAYVPATGLDASVVESLRGDSLIIYADDNPRFVATAHDVLEDWAILQWLEEQHLSEASYTVLSGAIGAHPALRRTFRKWIAELVDRDAGAADRLFQAAIHETQISVQFRDDTLVSLLKAPSAPAFLALHEPELIENDRSLLKRVIHLLRVACVKSPDWLIDQIGQGSILNVPDGSVWPVVIRLVSRNLTAFADSDRPLLLVLVEDAVRGASWWAPDLEGSEEVANIAYWLLDGLRDHGDKELRQRVLKVIAKIPRADATLFEATLRGHIEEGERCDAVAEDFQTLIYTGIDGMPASRDLPDIVISVGTAFLLTSEEDIYNKCDYAHSSLDIDLCFGMKKGLRFDSFPPSALRGPWAYLLNYHAKKALDFYIMVFNHSADWYVHPRFHNSLEQAWEVELTFADGSTHKQWMNGRLWGLYRGLSNGPHPLESMLMALEGWLLELGKHFPERLDSILVDILRRSNNAALSAVVGSVATAYPLFAGEALLVLLSVRDFIEVDRSRLVGEQQTTLMSGLFTTSPDHLVYEMERKTANAMPHRQYDLEVAVINLQFGPFALRVQDQLDKHLSAMTTKDQQDDEDRLWRLAIHRMDLRQYTVSDMPGPEILNLERQDDPPQHIVSLDPKPVDTDVQSMVDERFSRQAAITARLDLLMWGIQVFKCETDKCDPSQWTEKITEAQSIDREAGQEVGSQHAPGFIAALCIRDHWEEMTTSQREWCVDTVCAEVFKSSNLVSHIERIQKSSMAANRPCAFVLITLLRQPLDHTRTELVKAAFVVALTHPVEEVQWYTTRSIDAHVWATDRALALRCLNAIATEANIIDKAQKAEEEHPYLDRRDMDNIIAEARADIRSRFWKDGTIAEDAHVTLDISDRFGTDALSRMLVILGQIPKDRLAIAAFIRASHTLVAWWISDDEHQRRGGRNFEIEFDISRCIQNFLLRTSQEAAQQVLTPLLAVIDHHSRELQSVMQGLTTLQCSNPNTPQFWFLWGLIADAVKNAKWILHLETGRHSDGIGLLSTIFLTLYWDDNIRHWNTLDGNAHFVHLLFESLPATSVVLDAYTRFLYHIGERSLPEAFVRLAASLRNGNAQMMLVLSNTVFILEVLLQRFVYGRPLEIKRDGTIRNAVLFILDCLIETGSSAAFRIRDDFVTPASV